MPFHVRVTRHDHLGHSNDTVVLDKDEAWIIAQIVKPRSQGVAMFIDGQVIAWDDLDEIHITHSEKPSAELLPAIRRRRAAKGTWTLSSDDWYVAYESTDVTERFLSGPPGAESKSVTPTAENAAAVMVVHGQDDEAASALFDWLRAIGLEPREWSQLVAKTGSGSPFIGQVLERAFRETQVVVALFTPDERVAVRDELSGRASEWRLQARPNVMLEAGMAFAVSPDRTIMVVLGGQDLPSDLAGRHFVRLGDARALRALAARLENAGCPVDLSGDQWLEPTRFPNRSDLPVAPRLVPDDANPERKPSYAALLAAHDALLLAYSGRSLVQSTVRKARTAFDAAQATVLVHGDAGAREAAETLRIAWAPRVNGLYMGPIGSWRAQVEQARQAFVDALPVDR